MHCNRTHEIDLLDFLDAPGGPAFADFRSHYPTCATCASEVRAWTELRAGLQTQSTHPSHPSPESLLAFETGAMSLATDERERLAAHLSSCTTCREELAMLRVFDQVTRIRIMQNRAE